jgi:hypothetical protein
MSVGDDAVVPSCCVCRIDERVSVRLIWLPIARQLGACPDY